MKKIRFDFKNMDKKKVIYLVMVGVAFAFFLYIINPPFTGLTVADNEFIKLSNSVECSGDKILIQYIYYDNCGACKLQKPIMQELGKKYPEEIKIEYIDYYSPVNAGLIRKYDVKATPTIVFNCKYKIVGYHDFSQMEHLISLLYK